LIRPATAADAAGMAAVWDASARAGFSDLLPPGHTFPAFDLERLVELLNDDSVRILVDEQGGELRAHSTFGTSRDPEAPASVGEVRSFFVGPAAWRQGVGAALMARVLDGLAELGFEDASVWSFEANARANAFYERHGFERDGATRTEDAWAHVPEVRYRRTLP
jgi:GNAT superfamily N-acetyltransferase